MSDDQFHEMIMLLKKILEKLSDIDDRFSKYDEEEQINDEMLEEAQSG